MTDVDVAERVAAIFERAVVATRPRKAHHKRAYVTTIKGASAARMMTALATLLSQRRKRQIERALRHRAHPRKRAPRATRSATDGTILVWETAEPAARTAWLAGQLEGEGTFVVTRDSQSSYPVIKVEMCDEEIVARAGHILGAGRLYAHDPQRAGWSIRYVAKIGGHRAAEWMRRLRPYTGLRRSAAIDKALAAYQPIRLTQVPATCVVGGLQQTASIPRPVPRQLHELVARPREGSRAESRAAPLNR